jgi:hypothetical protein
MARGLHPWFLRGGDLIFPTQSMNAVLERHHEWYVEEAKSRWYVHASSCCFAVVLAALSLSLGLSLGSAAAQDDGTLIATPGQVGPGGDEDDPDARATEEAEDAEPTKAVSVDVLPSTGSGSSGGSILSYLVILGGAALVALAAVGSLRHRSPR